MTSPLPCQCSFKECIYSERKIRPRKPPDRPGQPEPEKWVRLSKRWDYSVSARVSFERYGRIVGWTREAPHVGICLLNNPLFIELDDKIWVFDYIKLINSEPEKWLEMGSLCCAYRGTITPLEQASIFARHVGFYAPSESSERTVTNYQTKDTSRYIVWINDDMIRRFIHPLRHDALKRRDELFGRRLAETSPEIDRFHHIVCNVDKAPQADKCQGDFLGVIRSVTKGTGGYGMGERYCFHIELTSPVEINFERSGHGKWHVLWTYARMDIEEAIRYRLGDEVLIRQLTYRHHAPSVQVWNTPEKMWARRWGILQPELEIAMTDLPVQPDFSEELLSEMPLIDDRECEHFRLNKKM